MGNIIITLSNILLSLFFNYRWASSIILSIRCGRPGPTLSTPTPRTFWTRWRTTETGTSHRSRWAQPPRLMIFGRRTRRGRAAASRKAQRTRRTPVISRRAYLKRVRWTLLVDRSWRLLAPYRRMILTEILIRLSSAFLLIVKPTKNKIHADSIFFRVLFQKFTAEKLNMPHINSITFKQNDLL